METRADYGRWFPSDSQSQCQIVVFLFLLVIVTVLAIYGGLSQGAIMSLLGFVPMFLESMKKEKKNKRHGISSSIEQKFEIESSVDETASCVTTDLTLSNVKGKRRKKFSYSRVFSLFRSKPKPSTDIFTISGDICEMEDLEFGRSKGRKEKNKKEDKDRDYFSSLDQLLLSLLNVGMMRKY